MGTKLIGIKKESIKNGMFLGGLLGVALLYGDKISPPLVNFLTKIVPVDTFLGSYTIPVIVIGVFIVIGYIIDKK